jgi:membrane peptidoglycan carboxypeptidase
MDERVAYLITDILSDNLARASTFGEASPLNLSHPAAAKTGTTTDWRDNWTMGYTPDLAVGVWAGNADNEPMRHVTGVMGAAPIWHDVMELLHRGQPVREFREPPGMAHVAVCADSGLLPAVSERPQDRPMGSAGEQAGRSKTGPDLQPSGFPTMRPCPHTLTELFIEGTQPTQTHDWHWLFSLDTRNGLLAGPGCPPQFIGQRLYTLYPAEGRDWARKQGIPQPPEANSPLCPSDQLADGRKLEDQSEDNRNGLRPPNLSPKESYGLGLQPSDLPTSQLILTSPDQGSRYRLSPEIPAGLQKIAIAVRPADGVDLERVMLLADGHPLATIPYPPYRVLWPMAIGTHVFSAVGIDLEGNELQGNRVVIEVVQ